MPQFIDEYGVAVTYYEWLVPSPKAIVQVAHGLGEYASRYEAFAKDLNAAGYSVIANDHRGHGETGMNQHAGDSTRLGRLGPGGLRAATADIHDLSELIRLEHPNAPLVLLGHSWGSLMAQKILNSHPGDYDGIVLTGTAYRTFTSMESGNLNKRHKTLGTTGYEWLSRDTGVSDAFLADPLTFYANVPKLFGIVDGLRLLGRPTKDLPPNLPVLIQIGSEDSLGGPKSIEKLAKSYRERSGLKDVQTKIYEGARHEIFNETNRDEVIGDLVAWLDAHLRTDRKKGA